MTKAKNTTPPEPGPLTISFTVQDVELKDLIEYSTVSEIATHIRDELGACQVTILGFDATTVYNHEG